MVVMPFMVRHRIHRHDVEAVQPDTALRRYAIGKGPDILHLALQYGHFQAVVFVDVDMQRGDRQIVVMMLGVRQPAGEIPRLVFIDIGKRREAGGLAILGRLLAHDRIPDDVPQRFRSAGIATPLAESVDHIQKLIVDADGDALHGICLSTYVIWR